MVTHQPIELFEVALKGIESGYYECLRDMPSDLSSHRTLFATHAFLGIDLRQGFDDNKVLENVSNESTDLARETAVQLLYHLLLPRRERDLAHRGTLHFAVTYVVRSSGKFEHELRRLIRDAYAERLASISMRTELLDSWEMSEAALRSNR